jgi:hypothetical protein
LGDTPEERVNSDRHLDANGIPRADLNALSSISVRRWLIDFVRLLWSRRRQLFENRRDVRIWQLAFYFARYCHLRLYLSALDRLPNARVALIGYDILFPPILAVALGVRGVSTVATQERFFAPFQGIYRLLFDHYLTIGARICRFVEKHERLAKIGHCQPIGPVRAESILKHLAPFPEKYAKIKRERALILALDFHSLPSAVENVRAMANHWKCNRRFYLDLIRLAVDFPRAHIVVKGKDTIATTLPVMRDIM